MSEADERLERILAEQVFAGGAYKPFARMTAGEVAARAEELRAAAAGPMQGRLAPVASVWEGLARAMREEGAGTVADLPRPALSSRADRLWVVPPGGSFL